MCFPQHPSRSSSREPRSRGSLSPSRFCAQDSEFSATFCLSVSPIRLDSIHHTSRLSRAGFSELWGAQRLRRAFLTVRLTQPWPPIRLLVRGLHRASFLAHLHRLILWLAFLLSRSRRCPMVNSTHLISWSGALAWNNDWEPPERPPRK